MLNSLEIKNYRNLRELKINSLGRVNLIIGKNNTGKSTLLETIAIYATSGELNLIFQMLEARGESFNQKEKSKNLTEINMRIFSSLFTDRNVGFDAADAILIGNEKDALSLKFVKYLDEMQKDEQGNSTRKRVYVQNNEDTQNEDYRVGFEIKTGKTSYTLPLDEDKPYRFGLRGVKNDSKVQFIETKNIDKVANGSLFDEITLTEKEQYVVEALKIVEPLTERIAFVEEASGERSAVIKLSDSQRVLPLRSMGDGINRILTIILALVNADKGFLLIDEFENGLRYTVQEQLWSIIFSLSQKLDIQVFATTHSEDCIRSFENVLNRSANFYDGKLVRLDNENGMIKQVEFNPKELQIANEQNIEIR